MQNGGRFYGGAAEEHRKKSRWYSRRAAAVNRLLVVTQSTTRFVWHLLKRRQNTIGCYSSLSSSGRFRFGLFSLPEMEFVRMTTSHRYHGPFAFRHHCETSDQRMRRMVVPLAAILPWPAQIHSHQFYTGLPIFR